jgi:hypothetical protein
MPIQHAPLSIVGMPIECTIPHTYVPDSLHYYQVINTYLVNEEPTVDLNPLIPLLYEHSSSPIQIKVNKRWKNMTSVTGTVRIPNKRKRDIIVSKAKDLYQIKTYTALPIRYHLRKHMAYLIMTSDTASLIDTDHNYRGRTTLPIIRDIIRKQYASCHVNSQGYVQDNEDDDEACTICGNHGTVICCETRTHCTGVYHPQCLSHPPPAQSDNWSCDKCLHPPPPETPWIDPLTEEELQSLRAATTLYSAADGSVRQHPHPSSTFGLVLANEDGTILVRRHNHIRVRPDDQSSFRAEIEALNGLHTLVPNDLIPNHIGDNE